MSYSISLGICPEALATVQTSSVDAVVTDPPYELGFMGKTWDSTGIAYSVELWREVLRVLKPGGHLLAFGGTRTYHRMTVAIEDAGFEIRDSLHWMYGQGFPKSLNAGEGRGTALKPAHEPVVMARKPLVGTVAANVAAFGTGALNIGACRVEGSTPVFANRNGDSKNAFGDGLHGSNRTGETSTAGRWPANVLLDESAAAELDAQAPKTGSHGASRGAGARTSGVTPIMGGQERADSITDGTAGASRFFYVAKPSRKERDLGCEHLPPKSGGEATDREDDSAGTQSPRAGAGRTGGGRNHHPTVKPVELMRYLVRLVTPPGGTVLDPFLGSGTTGMAAVLEGFGFVGIEMSGEYLEIARARIGAAEVAESP